jgi:hypothetical protein
MSDAPDYLMAYARSSLRKARREPFGPLKSWLRRIGSTYHLLAKQGAYSNIEFLDDFRKVRCVELDLVKTSQQRTRFGIPSTRRNS